MTDGNGLRVFVVEDEMTIALMIEDMLLDLGHRIAGLAMRLSPAMDMARTVEADVAVLDVNLDGHRSFPIAAILRERGVPVLFATGYGARGLEPPFESNPVIQKPFDVRDLQAALTCVTG
jgi:DNA-binding response OmpR family regulator